MSASRIVGPLLAIVVLAVLAAGMLLRLRSSSATEGEGSAVEGELPDVSATANFGTDVAISVTGAEVVRDTLVISVSAAAQAAPSRESIVLAEVAGRVQNIPVRESQRIGAGGLLVALDTTDLALALAEARANLAQAEAQFRELTLFDDQIEDQSVREERARVARAKSGLDQNEIAVRRRQVELDRASVVAPFNGRVADIEVTSGHRVNVGDRLMTVVDIDPIKVEVQVLGNEVGYLEAGRTAQVTFAAFPGETFVGRIATINPLVEQQSRTARVTVRIPNPGGRILPGMYARVSLEARRFADRVIVPKSAVLERDRRTMLFVYEGEEKQGLAKWNYVTTGLENDSLIEIVDSPETTMLEPGQVVLVDGHYTLTHDATVRLASPRDTVGRRPR